MKENIEVTTRKMYYYADIFVAVFVNLCFLIIYFYNLLKLFNFEHKYNIV